MTDRNHRTLCGGCFAAVSVLLDGPGDAGNHAPEGWHYTCPSCGWEAEGDGDPPTIYQQVEAMLSTLTGEEVADVVGIACATLRGVR